MLLCSEKILGMISVFLNLLRLVLWPNIWSILENVPYVLRIVCVLFLDKMYYICLLGPFHL